MKKLMIIIQHVISTDLPWRIWHYKVPRVPLSILSHLFSLKSTQTQNTRMLVWPPWWQLYPQILWYLQSYCHVHRNIPLDPTQASLHTIPWTCNLLSNQVISSLAIIWLKFCMYFSSAHCINTDYTDTHQLKPL
jgi:hypothetical protein